MIAYEKFNGFLTVGYILNGFKYISSFRCHCHLFEYRTMPLIGPLIEKSTEVICSPGRGHISVSDNL